MERHEFYATGAGINKQNSNYMYSPPSSALLTTDSQVYYPLPFEKVSYLNVDCQQQQQHQQSTPHPKHQPPPLSSASSSISSQSSNAADHYNNQQLQDITCKNDSSIITTNKLLDTSAADVPHAKHNEYQAYNIYTGHNIVAAPSIASTNNTNLVFDKSHIDNSSNNSNNSISSISTYPQHQSSDFIHTAAAHLPKSISQYQPAAHSTNELNQASKILSTFEARNPTKCYNVKPTYNHNIANMGISNTYYHQSQISPVLKDSSPSELQYPSQKGACINYVAPQPQQRPNQQMQYSDCSVTEKPIEGSVEIASTNRPAFICHPHQKHQPTADFFYTNDQNVYSNRNYLLNNSAAYVSTASAAATHHNTLPQTTSSKVNYYNSIYRANNGAAVRSSVIHPSQPSLNTDKNLDENSVAAFYYHGYPNNTALRPTDNYNHNSLPAYPASYHQYHSSVRNPIAGSHHHAIPTTVASSSSLKKVQHKVPEPDPKTGGYSTNSHYPNYDRQMTYNQRSLDQRGLYHTKLDDYQYSQSHTSSHPTMKPKVYYPQPYNYHNYPSHGGTTIPLTTQHHPHQPSHYLHQFQQQHAQAPSHQTVIQTKPTALNDRHHQRYPCTNPQLPSGYLLNNQSNKMYLHSTDQFPPMQNQGGYIHHQNHMTHAQPAHIYPISKSNDQQIDNLFSNSNINPLDNSSEYEHKGRPAPNAPSEVALIDLEEQINCSKITKPGYLPAPSNVVRSSCEFYNRPPYNVDKNQYVYNYNALNNSYQQQTTFRHHYPLQRPHGVGGGLVDDADLGDDVFGHDDEQLKSQNLRDFLASWNDDEEEEAAADSKKRNAAAFGGVISKKHKSDNNYGNIPLMNSSIPKIHVGIKVDNSGSNTNNLPDIIIDIEKPKVIGGSNNVDNKSAIQQHGGGGDEAAAAEAAAIAADKLYVLESFDVPLSDLNKYKHLNVVNKLPDNIVQFDESPKKTEYYIEESLKYIEEEESIRAKSFKNHFELNVEYDEEDSLKTVCEDVKMKEDKKEIECLETCEDQEKVVKSVEEIKPAEAAKPAEDIKEEENVSDGVIKKTELLEHVPVINTNYGEKEPTNDEATTTIESKASEPSINESTETETVRYKCIKKKNSSSGDDQAIHSDVYIPKLKIKIFRKNNKRLKSKSLFRKNQKQSCDKAKHHPAIVSSIEQHRNGGEQFVKHILVKSLKLFCINAINSDNFRDYFILYQDRLIHDHKIDNIFHNNYKDSRIANNLLNKSKNIQLVSNDSVKLQANVYLNPSNGNFETIYTQIDENESETENCCFSDKFSYNDSFKDDSSDNAEIFEDEIVETAKLMSDNSNSSQMVQNATDSNIILNNHSTKLNSSDIEDENSQSSLSSSTSSSSSSSSSSSTSCSSSSDATSSDDENSSIISSNILKKSVDRTECDLNKSVISTCNTQHQDTSAVISNSPNINRDNFTLNESIENPNILFPPLKRIVDTDDHPIDLYESSNSSYEDNKSSQDSSPHIDRMEDKVENSNIYNNQIEIAENKNIQDSTEIYSDPIKRTVCDVSYSSDKSKKIDISSSELISATQNDVFASSNANLVTKNNSPDQFDKDFTVRSLLPSDCIDNENFTNNYSTNTNQYDNEDITTPNLSPNRCLHQITDTFKNSQIYSSPFDAESEDVSLQIFPENIANNFVNSQVLLPLNEDKTSNLPKNFSEIQINREKCNIRSAADQYNQDIETPNLSPSHIVDEICHNSSNIPPKSAEPNSPNQDTSESLNVCPQGNDQTSTDSDQSSESSVSSNSTVKPFGDVIINSPSISTTNDQDTESSNLLSNSKDSQIKDIHSNKSNHTDIELEEQSSSSDSSDSSDSESSSSSSDEDETDSDVFVPLKALSNVDIVPFLATNNEINANPTNICPIENITKDTIIQNSEIATDSNSLGSSLHIAETVEDKIHKNISSDFLSTISSIDINEHDLSEVFVEQKYKKQSDVIEDDIQFNEDKNVSIIDVGDITAEDKCGTNEDEIDTNESKIEQIERQLQQFEEETSSNESHNNVMIEKEATLNEAQIELTNDLSDSMNQIEDTFELSQDEIKLNEDNIEMNEDNSKVTAGEIKLHEEIVEQIDGKLQPTEVTQTEDNIEAIEIKICSKVSEDYEIPEIKSNEDNLENEVQQVESQLTFIDDLIIPDELANVSQSNKHQAEAAKIEENVSDEEEKFEKKIQFAKEKSELIANNNCMKRDEFDLTEDKIKFSEDYIEINEDKLELNENEINKSEENKIEPNENKLAITEKIIRNEEIEMKDKIELIEKSKINEENAELNDDKIKIIEAIKLNEEIVELNGDKFALTEENKLNEEIVELNEDKFELTEEIKLNEEIVELHKIELTEKIGINEDIVELNEDKFIVTEEIKQNEENVEKNKDKFVLTEEITQNDQIVDLNEEKCTLTADKITLNSEDIKKDKFESNKDEIKIIEDKITLTEDEINEDKTLLIENTIELNKDEFDLTEEEIIEDTILSTENAIELNKDKITKGEIEINKDIVELNEDQFPLTEAEVELNQDITQLTEDKFVITVDEVQLKTNIVELNKGQFSVTEDEVEMNNDIVEVAEDQLTLTEDEGELNQLNENKLVFTETEIELNKNTIELNEDQFPITEDEIKLSKDIIDELSEDKFHLTEDEVEFNKDIIKLNEEKFIITEDEVKLKTNIVELNEDKFPKTEDKIELNKDIVKLIEDQLSESKLDENSVKKITDKVQAATELTKVCLEINENIFDENRIVEENIVLSEDVLRTTELRSEDIKIKEISIQDKLHNPLLKCNSFVHDNTSIKDDLIEILSNEIQSVNKSDNQPEETIVLIRNEHFYDPLSKKIINVCEIPLPTAAYPYDKIKSVKTHQAPISETKSTNLELSNFSIYNSISVISNEDLVLSETESKTDMSEKLSDSNISNSTTNNSNEDLDPSETESKTDMSEKLSASNISNSISVISNEELVPSKTESQTGMSEKLSDSTISNSITVISNEDLVPSDTHNKTDISVKLSNDNGIKSLEVESDNSIYSLGETIAEHYDTVDINLMLSEIEDEFKAKLFCEQLIGASKKSNLTTFKKSSSLDLMASNYTKDVRNATKLFLSEEIRYSSYEKRNSIRHNDLIFDNLHSKLSELFAEDCQEDSNQFNAKTLKELCENITNSRTIPKLSDMCSEVISNHINVSNNPDDYSYICIVNCDEINENDLWASLNTPPILVCYDEDISQNTFDNLNELNSNELITESCTSDYNNDEVEVTSFETVADRNPYALENNEIIDFDQHSIQYEEIVPVNRIMYKLEIFKKFLQSKYVQKPNYFRTHCINKIIKKYLNYQRYKSKAIKLQKQKSVKQQSAAPTAAPTPVNQVSLRLREKTSTATKTVESNCDNNKSTLLLINNNKTNNNDKKHLNCNNSVNISCKLSKESSNISSYVSTMTTKHIIESRAFAKEVKKNINKNVSNINCSNQKSKRRRSSVLDDQSNSSSSCSSSRSISQNVPSPPRSSDNSSIMTTKKRKLNFDEMLLDINRFYKPPTPSAPSVVNSNTPISNNNKINLRSQQSHQIPNATTSTTSAGSKERPNIIHSKDKVKRLYIPKSKIFTGDLNGNSISVKSFLNSPFLSQLYTPIVRIERKQCIDRLGKLHAITKRYRY